MTSNLGTEAFQRPGLGFSLAQNKPTNTEKERQKADVEKALRETFRPELLNRIDEIIVFDPLTEDDLKQIVELLLNDVRERLAERNVDLELTDAAKSALVTRGLRPGLRRAAAAPRRSSAASRTRSPRASWPASSPKATRRRSGTRTVSTRSIRRRTRRRRSVSRSR